MSETNPDGAGNSNLSPSSPRSLRHPDEENHERSSLHPNNRRFSSSLTAGPEISQGPEARISSQGSLAGNPPDIGIAQSQGNHIGQTTDGESEAGHSAGDHRRSMNLTSMDPQSFEYIEPVDRNLICPICHSAFVEPTILLCDHTFCRTCLKRSLETQEGSLTQRCPACRVAIPSLDWGTVAKPAPRIVIRMLEELMVRCPHSSVGCPVILARGDVGSHLERYCEYTLVPCPEAECRDKIYRKFSTQECLHGRSACSACGIEVTKLDLEDHQSAECPNRFAECNFCLETFVRSELEEHQPRCLSAPDECTGQEFGCGFKGTRGKVEEHEKSCQIALIAPSLRAQNAVLQKQREVLELQQRKILILEGSLRAIHNTGHCDEFSNFKGGGFGASGTTCADGGHAAGGSINLGGMVGTESPEIRAAGGVGFSSRHVRGYDHSEDPSEGGASRWGSSPPHPATPTSHLLSLHEDLRKDLLRLELALADVDSRYAMMIFNEGLRAKEEMTHVNAAIDSMRSQLHWLTSASLKFIDEHAPLGSETGGVTKEATKRSSSGSTSSGATSPPSAAYRQSAWYSYGPSSAAAARNGPAGCRGVFQYKTRERRPILDIGGVTNGGAGGIGGLEGGRERHEATKL